MGNEVESSETTGPEKKEKKSKTLLIIIVILLVLLIGTVAGATALLLSRDDNSTDSKTEEILPGGQIPYESTVITSEEAARQAAEAAKVENGNISLELSVVAFSQDGQAFECYIANAVENVYDIYIIILDENDEEVYRSGLIPVGASLQSFQTSTVLDKGDHECTVVYHQIAEDHITEVGTVAAGITLSVQPFEETSD